MLRRALLSRPVLIGLVVVLAASTLPLYVSGYVLGLLTVAYYYTPENKSILENGVVPTAEVATVPPEPGGEDLAPAPLGFNQLPSKDDPVVRRALDLLKNGTRKAA